MLCRRHSILPSEEFIGARTRRKSELVRHYRHYSVKVNMEESRHGKLPGSQKTLRVVYDSHDLFERLLRSPEMSYYGARSLE